MLGTIAGDIIGSAFESYPVKRTDFKLFSKESRFTDDTVLTIATAHAILRREDFVTSYKAFGCRYPDRGYGNNFHLWMNSDRVAPYDSWGNGSAMRVSPVGRAYDSIDSVLREAERSAEVTHNHPEGVKGAQAVALAVFLARNGAGKPEIRDEITNRFGYDLDRVLYAIRKNYSFDISCRGSVPESIIAFLESDSYEAAVRNAVSLGGDSDTMACIAGAIAEAYYQRIPAEIVAAARAALPEELLTVVDEFDAAYPLARRTRGAAKAEPAKGGGIQDSLATAAGLAEKARHFVGDTLTGALSALGRTPDRGNSSEASAERKLPAGIWDPFARAEDLAEAGRNFRFGMEVAAKREEWDKFLAPFEEKKPGEYPMPPNLCVPDGKLYSSPLHLAAQCGAPTEVVQKLVALGAWRTLQNGHGERPLDVAARAGHRHLLASLEPEYRMRLPWGVLRQIEHELHAMMRDYLGRHFKPEKTERYALRLPQVEPALETVNTALYLDIPWIPGGFNISFEGEGTETKLVVFANCRVSSGMDEKWEVTQAGRKSVRWA